MSNTLGILMSVVLAAAVSPRELTREEAALIASRIPAPYGERFLNGDEVKPKRSESRRRLFFNNVRRRWNG